MCIFTPSVSTIPLMVRFHVYGFLVFPLIVLPVLSSTLMAWREQAVKSDGGFGYVSWMWQLQKCVYIYVISCVWNILLTFRFATCQVSEQGLDRFGGNLSSAVHHEGRLEINSVQRKFPFAPGQCEDACGGEWAIVLRPWNSGSFTSPIWGRSWGSF